MRVLLAGISAHRQYIKSYESFTQIKIRDGDRRFRILAGRGDVSRGDACNELLKNPEFDAIFLCDLDQVFPEDCLEILREHDLDMVSGHYMKRTTKVLTSIWQRSIHPADWPYLPYIDPPSREPRLHRLANTGMGCVLIKRGVIEEIVEMLPYGSSPFEIGKLPDVAVPQGNFGSDYRFFYLAQKLGYELWGDSIVECAHATTLWLTRNTLPMLQRQRQNAVEMLTEEVFRNSIRAKGMLNANAIQARLLQLEEALKKINDEDERILVNGQILECAMWLEELKKHSPAPEAIEMWKKIYQFGNWQTPPQIRAQKVKLPTFNSEEEALAAVKNREVAIDGENPEEARYKRTEARKNQAMATAKNMDGESKHYQAFLTSTNKGEKRDV